MEVYTLDEWLEKNKIVSNLVKTSGVSDAKIQEHIEYGENLLREAMLKKDVKALDALIADQLRFTIPTGEIIGKKEDLGSYQTSERSIDELAILGRNYDEISPTEVKTTTFTSVKLTIIGNIFNERITFKRVWTLLNDRYQITSGSSAPTGEVQS